MSESMTVLCGRCRTPAETAGEEGAPQEAVCPTCGQRDNLEKAVEEAGEHFVYLQTQKMAKAFNKPPIKGGMVTMSTKMAVEPRTFRWISDQ